MARVYYGWVVVAATLLIYTLIMGTTYSSYGLFVLPLSHELKLSRADANTGIIFMNLGMAIQAPFLGMLLDRVPAKRLMILGSLLFVAAFAILSRSHQLWLSVAALALLLPFAFKSMGSLTGPLLIVRWFTVQRGRALAIAQLGLALGGVALPPVIGILIEIQGWRNALLSVGVAAGGLLFAIALLIKERPGADDREPGVATSATVQDPPVVRAAGRHLKVAQILAAPQYWTINLSCGLVAAMQTALLITLAPLARAQGLSMLQAASLVSVMSGFGSASMLLVAVVADYVDRVVLLSILFALAAAVNVQLMFSHSYVLLVAAAAAIGLLQGATVPMEYALLADCFGTASYGLVTGLTIPLISVLGIVVIRYSGQVFDRTGGYEVLFMTFAVLQMLAAAIVLATRFVRANGDTRKLHMPVRP